MNSVLCYSSYEVLTTTLLIIKFYVHQSYKTFIIMTFTIQDTLKSYNLHNFFLAIIQTCMILRSLKIALTQ